jgi:hypothetical protein
MKHWNGNADEAIHFSEQFALEYFLSEYPEILTYDQILTVMTEEPEWENEIKVWFPFEKLSGKHLADLIHLCTLSLTARLLNA